MWAKLLQTILTSVVVPLLKDLAFMVVHFFKVRAIRKEREAEAKRKLEAYQANPSDENFGQLP